MTCLLALLALCTPRLVIIGVVIFSDYIGRAYETNLVPFLGFLFLPLTTLAYAWAINTTGSVEGLQLVVVVIAVLADLGMLGGSESARRKRGD